MRCGAVRCSAVQCGAVQCSAMDEHTFGTLGSRIQGLAVLLSKLIHAIGLCCARMLYLMLPTYILRQSRSKPK